MAAQIWEYQQQQQAQLVNHCVEICAAFEESFLTKLFELCWKRLLGQEFPCWFQWVVPQMRQLPHPRKPQKLPNPETVVLPSGPS